MNKQLIRAKTISPSKFIKNIKACIGKLILKTRGWELVGEYPEHLDKIIMIAAPHTSNWDLPWMLCVSWAWKQDINWLGKKEIFEMPVLGPILRHWGGVAIDRQHKTGYVDALVAHIGQQEQFCLVVPPEGTRSKNDRGWRTGFYHIASAAKLPIYFGFLDYKTKRAGIGGHLVPTGDKENDLNQIKDFYGKLVGKYPETQSEVKFSS